MDDGSSRSSQSFSTISIATPFLAHKSSAGPQPMELYFRYLSRVVGKPSDTKPKRHNHLRELFAYRGWLIAESRSKRIWPLLYLYKWNYSGPRARAIVDVPYRSGDLQNYAFVAGRTVPTGKSREKSLSVSEPPD